MIETCYMCNAIATSREHAPPQCLFPKELSIGRDLRKNLITVPSCDVHNSKKSEDDEFLRAILCLPAAGVSAVATQNFSEKVLSGARRSPSKYAVYAPRADAVTPPGTSAFIADRKRLDRCIEHMAKALCFHTCGVKWPYAMAVGSPQLLTKTPAGSLASHRSFDAAIAATRDFLSAEPTLGENPEVFLYRIKVEGDMLGFGALFYGHFEVFAASSATIVG